MWGEASPIYLSKVRGLFPADDPDGVIRATMLAKCMIAREYRPHDPRLEPVELGVDVGAGGDKTDIVLRRGCKATLVDEISTRDPEIVAGAIVKAIKEFAPRSCKIDTIGWGWGVAGQVKQNIRESGIECQIVGVQVSERASDPERFANLRAEIWWDVGRANCEELAWDLSEMGDQCAADLLAPKWVPTPRGQIKVEAKDEIRKRLGRSPDQADALLLAFYDGRYGLEMYLDALAAEQRAARAPKHIEGATPASEIAISPEDGRRIQQYWDALGKR